MIDYDEIKPVIDGMVTLDNGFVIWSIYGTTANGVDQIFTSIDSDTAIGLVVAQFAGSDDE